MKISHLASIASLLVATLAFAQDKPPSEEYVLPKDYPMTTCVVTGDQLVGGYQKPVEHVHKEPDKPDRLIILCCEYCIVDFQGNPPRYLKILDEAAAAKKSDTKAGKQDGGGHKH